MVIKRKSPFYFWCKQLCKRKNKQTMIWLVWSLRRKRHRMIGNKTSCTKYNVWSFKIGIKKEWRQNDNREVRDWGYWWGKYRRWNTLKLMDTVAKTRKAERTVGFTSSLQRPNQMWGYPGILVQPWRLKRLNSRWEFLASYTSLLLLHSHDLSDMYAFTFSMLSLTERVKMEKRSEGDGWWWGVADCSHFVENVFIYCCSHIISVWQFYSPRWI